MPRLGLSNKGKAQQQQLLERAAAVWPNDTPEHRCAHALVQVRVWQLIHACVLHLVCSSALPSSSTRLSAHPSAPLALRFSTATE